jgi:hypothetical protein
MDAFMDIWRALDEKMDLWALPNPSQQGSRISLQLRVVKRSL